MPGIEPSPQIVQPIRDAVSNPRKLRATALGAVVGKGFNRPLNKCRRLLGAEIFVFKNVVQSSLHSDPRGCGGIWGSVAVAGSVLQGARGCEPNSDWRYAPKTSEWLSAKDWADGATKSAKWVLARTLVVLFREAHLITR